jgi:hypothetical protein
MGNHPARICLARSEQFSCGEFNRATRKRYGLLLAMITLATSVTFSSCASQGSAASGSGSGNALTGNLPGSPTPSNTPGAHDVTLNWNPSSSSGVLGYNVYRGTGSGGPYTKLNRFVLPTTSYTDNAVDPGQTYYYVVTATNSGNEESAFSNEIAEPIP